MVMLMPSMKDAMMFMPGGTSRTDKDGNFTLNGVTPGEYSLQIQSMGGMIQASAARNMMAFTFATSADGPPAPPAGPHAARVRDGAPSTSPATTSPAWSSSARAARRRPARSRSTGGARPDGIASIRVTVAADGRRQQPDAVISAARHVKDTGAFEIESLVGGHIVPRRQPAARAGS